MLQIFWYPSPDLCLDTILSPSSTDNSFDLLAWFLLWHTLSTVGSLYRRVCSFPNHVQSIEFTTGGLQSSCRNISRMINGNRMHLSSISSLIAKGLNTYVNKVCLKKQKHLQTFIKTYFHFVTKGYCVDKWKGCEYFPNALNVRLPVYSPFSHLSEFL